MAETPAREAGRTLAARALRRRFGDRVVVDGVDLTISAGEIVGLLGPNGAGKTVTFYMLVGLLRPTSGRVLLDGSDVTDQPMHERARRGLAYLPQERSIFRGLNARDNVAAILECRGTGRWQARRRAEAVLDEFGLAHVAGENAARLSGGEQRRLEVARAVALEPRILLLDEPFAGIDPLTVEMIHDLLVGLSRRGIGILISDHNVREALLLSHRAYVLFDGQVLAEGSADSLLRNPEVRHRFVGEDYALGADTLPMTTARRYAGSTDSDWRTRPTDTIGTRS